MCDNNKIIIICIECANELVFIRINLQYLDEARENLIYGEHSSANISVIMIDAKRGSRRKFVFFVTFPNRLCRSVEPNRLEKFH